MLILINDCEFDNKKCLIKKRDLLFFKQKCHILTHNIRTQMKSIIEFGLHKLIFVLL